MYLSDIFNPEKDFFLPAIFDFDAPQMGRRPMRPRGGERPPHPHDMMKMDVVEKDDSFEVKMNIPGYDKEDIAIELKDGMLEVTAKKEEKKEEKDENGKFIRRERFTGQCTRRFGVPNNLTENDINASFENGVLNITIPKKEEEKPERKLIEIK